MNLLTKSLLEDLLDTQKTVAIYGGGFKPPTKGHFNVAELALSELPDIDELKIFVGGGVRDGITQDESIQVWDIYKKYLSPKVSVEPSVAPVKSVLGYAKENPDTKVYWVLGARDGEESDLEDIKNRTKSLDKYPNLEVKVITSKGGISGTKTRTAIKANNKEQFFHFIPDIKEKEQVWDIVSPVIKEGFIGDIKTKLSKFISAVKQEGKETKEAVSLLIKSAKGDVELSNEQKEQIGNQLKDVLKLIGLTAIAALPGGFIAGALIKLFKAEALITPSAFVNEVGEANLKPYKWEEVDREGYYVYTRFVTDSETQYDVDIKSTIYFPPGQMDSQPALEIEFSAKPKGAEGSSAKIVVNKGEMYRVMSTIVDIIKKYIKKSKTQAIIYSPSKKSDEESFGTQRDNLYRAFISKAFPGTTFKQSGDFITAILPSVKEGTCGYDTDVKTGKKLDTPGGLEEGRPKKKDPKKGTGKKPEGSGRRLYTDEDPKDTVRIKFKTKEDIVDTLNKTSFKAKSHARQSQVINLIHQRVRAAYGKAKDPEVKSRLKRALDYIEKRKEMSKKKTERLRKLKELVTATEVICDNCGWEWAIKDGGDDLYICHKCGHDNTPKQLNETPSEVQVKKINISFELFDGTKISEDITLAMSPNSQGVFELGANIAKYTGLSLKDAQEYNETPDDAYAYGLVNTMNDGQDIYFWTNGTRLAGKAKKAGAQTAVIEQLAHEGLHLTRAILAKSLMGDKFPTGEWPSMGEQGNDTIEEEQLTTALSFVIEHIAPSFIEMAKEYIPELNDQSISENLVNEGLNENYQFKVSDKVYDEEDNSLISVDYEFSTPNNDYRVEFYSGEYSPESKTFDISFGIDQYGSKLDTFQMTGEGNALSILKTIVDIIKDFTNRFEVNKLIINPTSEKRGKVYSMILKALPSDILNKVKLVKETKSDPFGLNELAKQFGEEIGRDLTKGWNPQKDFVSLSIFMIDNGMNIKPLPKIKVIKDDKENASDLLGKTAYYNPTEKSITLYTMDRHPKDILRSFAHEMVHHEQNLDGRLGNINTTNTNEDGDLPEIEREAYEKGNMMLRNWEDKIKNV
jgi:hypothetical protein